MPTLSVILPVWRPVPEFLLAAVESILRQTFEDFELLVVEDPSDTAAGEILSGIDDPRLRLVTHPTRTTMVDQLNRGIELSRAPWLARMDADDISLPQRFEIQLAALEASPEIDVLGTQIEVIDGSGQRIGRRLFPTTHEGIVRALHRFNPISHPSVIMRRSTVVEAGGYAYPERPAQDYELWSRLASRGARFANLPSSLVHYRLHGESVKSRQVKGTLRAGIETKKEYWWDSMTWKDRLRYAAENVALYVPSRWIYALARKRLYQSVSSGAAERGEPGE
jgi:glycosyltransferase involved in cell wall biosynthesis